MHYISVDRRELVESLIDGEHRERLINSVVLGRSWKSSTGSKGRDEGRRAMS